MFPGLNPKKMQAMMKQMGIKQEEIDASRVIIEKEDGRIIINEPSVVRVNMQGQETFQISGEIIEEAGEEESEKSEEAEKEEDTTKEDIKTIMEKVSCLEEEARMAYEKANGDLTEAILSLS